MSSRKAKGPRIIGRYVPPTGVRIANGDKEQILLDVQPWVKRAVALPSREQVTAQQSEAVKIDPNIWLYHDYWVLMEDSGIYREDEVAVLIKRVVLREERARARERQEVEALERGDLTPVERTIIPDRVRIFVWQRDGGKCVRCGGTEKLEFDHIIPVADGGSSTERNVRLLCEPCNRSKGRSVM